MGRVDVNKYNKQNNSDVFTLTNVSNNQSVALIPSDSAGNFNWSGIRRAPLERNAMQTTTSSGEWSDLEYPWMAIQQEDWTGGRGNDRFTSDKSRFFDSKRAQSAFNQVIINAPLDYYSDGIKDSKTNCPASVKWMDVVGDTHYIYQEIQFSTSMTIGELYIHLKKTGSPSPLTVSLRSSTGSNPTVYAYHQFTASNVTDITAEFFKFSFTNVALSGSVYLYITSFDGDSQNHWSIGTSLISGLNCYTSNNGSTWNNAQKQVLYRLQPGTVSGVTMKYFTYHQLMFMIKNVSGTSTLWINGDIGKCTTASNGYTITDSRKSWTNDQWIGAKFGLTFGTGVELIQRTWADITDNTSNTLTVSNYERVGTDSQYIITNTPHWTQISAPLIEASNRECSDILVCRDTVFFCFGKSHNVISMKWSGSAFTFTDTGFYADFLQSVRSTKGLMLWRGRNNDDNNKRSIDRALYYDYPAYNVICTIASAAANATTTSSVLTLNHSLYAFRFTVGSITKATDKKATLKVQESDDETTWTDLISMEITTQGSYIRSGKPSKAKQRIAIVTDEEITVTNLSVDIFVFLNTTVATTDTEKKKLSGLITISQPDTDDCEYMVITEKGIGTTDASDGTVIESQNGSSVIVSGSGGTTGTTVDWEGTTVTVYLEESLDGVGFTSVGSVALTDVSVGYIQAKLKYPYARVRYTIDSGTKIGRITIAKSSTPRWQDHFTFLDNYGAITRLFEYGADAAKSLWIFQEGMVSSVTYSGDTYNVDRINIDELATTADQFNGMAVATSDVYLLFGWLNGVQRYYNTQMEGKGPDKDEGLPSNRRGRISKILSYPSNWFVSVDAGTNGYSSVLMFNQSGWHEIYRAPNIGERILDIAFQPIYGDEPDKLWMQVGDNAVWLAMPSKVLYALHDPNAKYTHESVIVSSWITGGMAEVDKLWQSIGIMADNLDGTNCWVEVDYQVDDESEWHTIANHFVTSPSQEEDFSEYSVNGKKLRYRLRLQTTDISKTPKINAVLIKSIGRVDVKHSYSFYFRNIKYKPDLTGEYEEIEPYDLQCILDEWANKLYKLRLNSAYRIFDDKLVFLDAVETSVLNELSEGYLGQITLTEV